MCHLRSIQLSQLHKHLSDNEEASVDFKAILRNINISYSADNIHNIHELYFRE